MEDFDLEQYISAYAGEAYIERLVFIATQSPAFAAKALRLAINGVKLNTSNTARYAELVQRHNELAPNDTLPLDTAWVDEQDKKAASTLNSLELELNHHLSSQNKEGSRVTLMQLGHYYYSRGDYENALRTYLRPRTDCSTQPQILELYTNVVRAMMALKRSSHAISYVAKAECVKPEEDSKSKLNTFAGLGYLDRGAYDQAAQRFLAIRHADPELVSFQDIAIYGCLCALATFSRAELKAQVIDNAAFKQFLEVTPVVQTIVSDFYKSKYSSCFSSLERLAAELKLDLHIHSHTARLLSAIRHKAILQYFSPFASVSLSNMARAFNTDVASIEKEVASIIAAGQLAAKIDSHSKILYASQTQRRQQTFQNALRLAEEYESNASALVLRVNLLKADFLVRQPRHKSRDVGIMGQGPLFQAMSSFLGMGMPMGI